jgi:hypothetical protein
MSSQTKIKLDDITHGVAYILGITPKQLWTQNVEDDAIPEPDVVYL